MKVYLIKYTEFFKTLNQNLVEYSKFTIFYDKANRKRMTLAQSKKITHKLFDSVPIGNILYLQATIFEIPRKCFIIKSSAC